MFPSQIVYTCSWLLMALTVMLPGDARDAAIGAAVDRIHRRHKDLAASLAGLAEAFQNGRNLR